jgi:hypothetical protein
VGRDRSEARLISAFIPHLYLYNNLLMYCGAEQKACSFIVLVLFFSPCQIATCDPREDDPETCEAVSGDCAQPENGGGS